MSPIDDKILQRLDARDDFSCELPPTASGKAQRSGYPDLKITHEQSDQMTEIIKECDELIAIFVASVKTAEANQS